MGNPDRRRGVIAIFDDREAVRRAVAEVRRCRGAAGEIALFAGPEALRRCGLLPAPAAGGKLDELERALGRGALLVLVPVGDPGAEKRVSLALLRHSRDAVQIRDLGPLPGRDEKNEPETDPAGARP